MQVQLLQRMVWERLFLLSAGHSTVELRKLFAWLVWVPVLPTGMHGHGELLKPCVSRDRVHGCQLHVQVSELLARWQLRDLPSGILR